MNQCLPALAQTPECTFTNPLPPPNLFPNITPHPAVGQTLYSRQAGLRTAPQTHPVFIYLIHTILYLFRSINSSTRKPLWPSPSFSSSQHTTPTPGITASKSWTHHFTHSSFSAANILPSAHLCSDTSLPSPAPSQILSHPARLTWVSRPTLFALNLPESYVSLDILLIAVLGLLTT